MLQVGEPRGKRDRSKFNRERARKEPDLEMEKSGEGLTKERMKIRQR